MSISAISIIEQLRSQRSNGEFTGYLTEIYPGSKEHRIGIESDTSNIVVLIKSSNIEKKKYFSTRLENLEIDYDYMCDLLFETNTIKSRYTVIRLKNSNATLEKYFLKFIDSILRAFNENIDLVEVKADLNLIINLFSKLNTPPKKTLQGLFAELIVIISSNNIERHIRAWHKIPTEKFDFVFDDKIIEVKSSGSNERLHSFSNSQLLNYSKETVDLHIASIIVLESDDGITINQLVEKIERNLEDPVLYKKLIVVPLLVVSLHFVI